jgi:hypothetical protein
MGIVSRLLGKEGVLRGFPKGWEEVPAHGRLEPDQEERTERELAELPEKIVTGGSTLTADSTGTLETRGTRMQRLQQRPPRVLRRSSPTCLMPPLWSTSESHVRDVASRFVPSQLNVALQ